MDKGGCNSTVMISRILKRTWLTVLADTALSEFRDSHGVSEVDAVNALLQLGGACAEFLRTGELVYLTTDGEASRILVEFGDGQPI
jgi:hypothetical protein